MRAAMKTDVILCGVGGQGVLSAAGVLSEAGLREGLEVRQGEVHGMAQRGGAVQASLRLSDEPIPGALVPRGTAELLLALEPLEALRYTDYLSPEGWIVAAEEPVRNIPDYPELEAVHRELREHPRTILVPAERLARKAGSAHAANTVLVGAAIHLLPVAPATVEGVLADAFQVKGEKVVQANLEAFRSGRSAAVAER
jgi:indolepyruvate ferredoxin oxidoreductase beta subunit